MLHFVNDYSEGAHERILERLIETNREPLSGYGTDCYCASAKKKISLRPFDSLMLKEKEVAIPSG